MNFPPRRRPPPKSVPVQIYLLGANHKLVPVSRVVPIPAPLKSVVFTSSKAPRKKRNGMESGQRSRAMYRCSRPPPPSTPALATVNLNEKFEEITGAETELAVAQIVFTVVTQTNLATGVIFQINGVPINVPMGNGTQSSGPVYLSQYAANAPQ